MKKRTRKHRAGCFYEFHALPGGQPGEAAERGDGELAGLVWSQDGTLATGVGRLARYFRATGQRLVLLICKKVVLK